MMRINHRSWLIFRVEKTKTRELKFCFLTLTQFKILSYLALESVVPERKRRYTSDLFTSILKTFGEPEKKTD